SIGGGHYSAKCSYCFEKWNRERPDELKSHLVLYCNNISQNVKLKYLELLVTDNSNKKFKNDENSSKKLIPNFYESPTKIEKSKKNRIDQALIRFFICCGISFSTVNHLYFIDFIQCLCLGYMSPKRRILLSTILNQEISS
ncbi:10061_t:CDS:1, partial [Cetraspora pellucida]